MSELIPTAVSDVYRQRYDRLANAYLKQCNDLIPQLTGETQLSALVMLDAEYPTIEALFNTVLNERDQLAPLYHDLFVQLTTYFNLRGIVDDPLIWGTVLILKETRDEALIDVSILNTLAMAQDSTGNAEAAFTIYEFLLEEFADEPDHPGLGAIHHNLSLAYKRQGRFEEAAHHARQSLTIERQHNHQRGSALALMNLSELLYRQDELIPAFLMLQQAIDLVDDSSDLFLQATMAQRVAVQMAEYAPPGRTDRTFQLAIRLWKQYNDPVSLAKTYFDYAAFHHACGKLDEARSYAYRSRDLFASVGSGQVERVQRAIDTWLSSPSDASDI